MPSSAGIRDAGWNRSRKEISPGELRLNAGPRTARRFDEVRIRRTIAGHR